MSFLKAEIGIVDQRGIKDWGEALKRGGVQLVGTNFNFKIKLTPEKLKLLVPVFTFLRSFYMKYGKASGEANFSGIAPRGVQQLGTAIPEDADRVRFLLNPEDLLTNPDRAMDYELICTITGKPDANLDDLKKIVAELPKVSESRAKADIAYTLVTINRRRLPGFVPPVPTITAAARAVKSNIEVNLDEQNKRIDVIESRQIEVLGRLSRVEEAITELKDNGNIASLVPEAETAAVTQ